MPSIDWDFFTKQDVKISLLKEDKTIYIVKFLSSNPILFYQVWDKTGKNNDKRYADELFLNDYIQLFLNYNLKNKIKFAPTTVIEIDNDLHVLVMIDVKLDKKGKTIAYFKKNSVERNKLQPIDSKLPLGIFKNVRFDIDSVQAGGCDPQGNCLE
jgi:hypothetical protein